jgi:hypothetical protein
MTPKLGQHYSVNVGPRLKPSILELARVEADSHYPYIMRFVSADPQSKWAPGDEFSVENNWFIWRGSLPAGTVGAVREVE